jgi:two-component system chemotaxis sensor kinase CheA
VSLEIDLGEFLTAYLAEADEHVSAANARLLAIERAVQAGKHDARAIRDLFRTLHTIKGLSAMVGVEPIVAIAHAMETIVRASDRSGIAPRAGVIEPLFRALEAIVERLAALSRGETPAAPPPELLDRLAEAEAPSGAAPASAVQKLALDPAIEAKLAAFERDLLMRAPSDGRRAVRADFVPSPSRAASGLSINSVRERVSAVAEIVKVVPLSVPATGDGPGGLRFALLLVTGAATEAIADAVGCTPSEVVDILAAGGGAVEAAPASTGFGDEVLTADDDAGAGRRGVLRIDVARVDDAMERLSALLVTRSRLARAVAELASTGAATRELQAILNESTRQLRDLRASILRLRVVPFADVLARLPLVVRGLTRESGKDVRLVTDANGAELDKSVAEHVFPALVHLLRNAVDHGIESTAERVRSGKPPHGTIKVSCTTIANRQLQIRVADDGAGIDADALARTAGHAIEATGAAILEVLCRPGMSTRTEATSTSGRGMGMDIVRKTVVDQLRGELGLETTRGEGTIFTLRVPLTVAMLDAFTVRCEGEVFAVPVSSVEEILEIEQGDMVRGPARGGRMVSLLARRGEAVPVVHLFDVLGRSPVNADLARHALVVRRGGAPVAFRLDRVLGQQETVVRPLTDPLVQAPGVAGSADLGDGRATLVLDLHALAAAIGAESGATEDVA